MIIYIKGLEIKGRAYVKPKSISKELRTVKISVETVRFLSYNKNKAGIFANEKITEIKEKCQFGNRNN